MIQVVNATYKDGILTPVEPLDFREGAVVRLTIQELPSSKGIKPEIPFRVKPLRGGTFTPGDDPKKLKDLMYELEDEEFLRKSRL